LPLLFAGFAGVTALALDVSILVQLVGSRRSSPSQLPE
jgi:hypothetical protein